MQLERVWRTEMPARRGRDKGCDAGLNDNVYREETCLIHCPSIRLSNHAAVSSW